jgi:hypothetical protein
VAVAASGSAPKASAGWCDAAAETSSAVPHTPPVTIVHVPCNLTVSGTTLVAKGSHLQHAGTTGQYMYRQPDAGSWGSTMLVASTRLAAGAMRAVTSN